MKKKNLLKRAVALLIGLLICLPLVSCNQEPHGQEETDVNAGADTSDIPEIPPTSDTEGPVIKGPVPEVVTGKDTVTVSSAELLELIVSGTIKENGDYAVTDGEGIVFARAHNEKEYDLKNALIRIGVRSDEFGIVIRSRRITLKNARIAVYGGTAIGVDSENAEPTLSEIHVSGNGAAAFDLGGNEATLSECTVCPDEGGSIASAVLATGSNALILNCNIRGTGIGVTDVSATGATVQNCLFTDCSVAILCKTANTVAWYNTVNGGRVGVMAEDDGAEISAAMGTVYNVLAAKNRIVGAEQGILFEKVSNCVAVMNEADGITFSDCINAYAVNNRVADTLTVNRSDYVIVDRNTYGSLQTADNTNVNGDNLTDLNERATVGVNEQLLPHINKEQFAGMVGRAGFRTEYGVTDLSTFVEKQISDGTKEILIPPGVHNNGGMSLNGVSDLTIYAYGVYNDIIKTGKTAIAMTDCEAIELYGIFIGSSVHPNYQGTVTSVTGKAGKETVTFVADPGYLADYTKSSNFPATNGGGGTVYKPDSGYPYSEVWYENATKSYHSASQTTTVTLISEGIKYGRLPYSGMEANPFAVGAVEVGDRIAFRTYMSYNGISMSECTEIALEDVTVFNSAGFAISDYDSDVAVSMHRCAVTGGPAPILDRIVSSELATVNEQNKHVTWKDSYGRLRSAFYLNTTCDATHNTNSRVGMQAVSCLFEGMMDDGGNINAHYGTAVGYDSTTNVFTYKRCNTGGYRRLPQNFQVGDSLLLFTKSGDFIDSVTVTSATVQTVTGGLETDERYTVKLSKDITLPADTDSVIVQNASASGNGFLWDNVAVRNNNSYGIRIQGREGEIRNCSFIGLAKGGVSMIPQYVSWPECGYASDIKVTKNVFEELGLMAAQWHDWDSVESGSSFMPLCIQAPGGTTADLERCMFERIEISDNHFRSRYTYYDIYIAAAKDLTVTGNVFTGRKGMESADQQKNIIITGGNGIRIDGNTFTGSAEPHVYVKDGVAQNITGSDTE